MTLPPAQKKPAEQGTHVEEDPSCIPCLRVFDAEQNYDRKLMSEIG
jgi:hypothetical protein